MKKSILLIFAIFASLFTFGQTQLDALRFSQLEYGGTARSVAMGNSFGALGADLSSMAINPAGIALYRKGEISFTPALSNSNISSSFNGTNKTSIDNGFLVNNIGFAIAFNDETNTSDWKGASFGFAYNRLNNFRQTAVIEGVNDKGSMIGVFVDNANIQDPTGSYNSLNDFYEKAAYECYLIDYFYAGDESEYWSPVTDEGKYGEIQRKTIRREGGMGEFDFSFGVNYKDILYLGGTMGIQSLNYRESSTYKESEIPYSSYTVNIVNADTSYSYILDSPDYFTVDEDLSISGTGINLKLGLIARPIDWLRVGAAFHTPTFLSLTDNYETSFYAKYDFELPNGQVERDWITSYDQPYSYELRTPMRFVGSLGFVIMKIAAVNVDYEYVDFSRAVYSHFEDDFTHTNELISSELTSASNVRAGAEVKLGAFSLRGGFGMYGNPYSSDLNRIDATKFVYSGGAGISGGNFYVDFAYSLSTYKDNYFMYNGYVDEPIPTLTFKQGVGMVTFGVKF